MKHKIIYVLTVLAIIISTVACVRAWDHYQVQARAVATANRIAKEKQAQLTQSAVDSEKKRVNAQCHTNQAFYDSQSVTYRKANARPVCDLPLAQ